ncbi:MAG: hypothetical protein E6H84_14190 [Chloroflexi bacterium]|nr:MAG: hypothetical protein E6H84_14190 [Chloroflexota bacterium]TMG65845.1 MAG: hypothetical protein E6H81_14800 [Chloroflexota bacterium]
MSEFSFTLVLDAGELSRNQINGLYGSVPDSTASERNGKTYVGMDREAPDFGMAVVSAIEDVERALPDVTVVAVEPEDLVSQSDIANRTSRSRESISQLVNGERGPGHFPQPSHHVAGRALWRWPTVERWFDAYEGRTTPKHHDAFLDAVNALLTLRRSRQKLGLAELEALRHLTNDDAVVAV